MEIRRGEGSHWLFVSAPEFEAEFEISGDAPVQAFGTVLGRELHFRARHDAWSFEVADHHGNLPSNGRAASDGFLRTGSHPNASYLPLEKGVSIIQRCLREYTGG